MSQTKKTYDKNAIEQTMIQLLDESSFILDKINVSGLRFYLEKEPALKSFIEIIEMLEEELLIQWKIVKENKLKGLFERQKSWLNQEMRKKQNLFTSWNRFWAEVMNSVTKLPVIIHKDPWQAFLWVIFTDSDFFRTKDHNPIVIKKSGYLNIICDVFQLLREVSPHDFLLGFLNLIEISVGYRPETPSLGLLETPDKQPAFNLLYNYFSPEIEGGQITALAGKILCFWENNSGGIFSLYPAFLLKLKRKRTFQLIPVMPEKTHSFQDLVGMESQKQQLINNTAAFIKGKKSPHVLIWGSRGTGKSSSVLALLTEFAGQGLRLIEITQQDLEILPKLTFELGKRPEKFILYCDDMGFEAASNQLKQVKSRLEGSSLSPAKNLMFMVTSNRKDLVLKGDYNQSLPEHRQILDEKRALDDRFGIKIYFPQLGQKKLRKILFFYADQTSKSYHPDDLYREFTRFAGRNNHDQPSGRTVQQFVEYWNKPQTNVVK